MTTPRPVRVGGTALREPDHRQHVVGVYSDDDDLLAATVAYLADGLVGDGTAIVIATPEHRAALEAELVARGIDTQTFRDAGRYLAIDAAAALAQFMVDGRPDPARFASTVGAIVADAERAGGPVRCFGEMVALLWECGNPAGAIELESLWNDLASCHSFSLLCAYALSSLEASGDLGSAKEMCDRHSRVIALTRGAPVSHAPGGVTADAYERVFVALPSELRNVREFVRDVLRSWGDDECDGAADVVASELATNSVRHARSPFRISIGRAPSAVRIEVRDASFDLPEQSCGNVEDVGGRGIRLVAALSLAWGTRSEPDGKTVWADVARHQDG